ncbi:hypothetical protein [Stenotrophomonas pavanii]|uniref:hypothetical protein n=1 Tax=Stenotrophomonas pavanii TaxID=487698 RepID=UPI0015F60D2A|nr:hypothetical protein [Stenotrophomonas pavanii]
MGYYGPRGRYEKHEYWPSVGRLIGHLIGTVIIFGVFFTLGWLLSVLLHLLHSWHPFPNEIFQFITKIELWVIYADFGLCLIVLVAGGYRFVREVIGAN